MNPASSDFLNFRTVLSLPRVASVAAVLLLVLTGMPAMAEPAVPVDPGITVDGSVDEGVRDWLGVITQRLTEREYFLSRGEAAPGWDVLITKALPLGSPRRGKSSVLEIARTAMKRRSAAPLKRQFHHPTPPDHVFFCLLQ